MIVFLYRPSPQVPEPSLRAAQLCFEASRFNVYVQRQQIANKSVDLTWIFTQSLFMAINTLLWALSYSGIRKDHPRTEVETHLTTALEAVYLASQKWPGVESARELYTTLVEACLKAYDGDENISYSVGSPPTYPAASPQSIDTPPPLSTPSTIHSTLATYPQASGAEPQSPTFAYTVDSSESVPAPTGPTSLPPTSQPLVFGPELIHATSSLEPPQAYVTTSSDPREIFFNPNSYDNPLPSPLSYGYSPELTEAFYAPYGQPRNHYLESIGDQYAQYLQTQYIPQEPMEGLSMEQQTELMNNLEMNGLNGPIREKSPSQYYNGVGYST